jgi:hypothetical protein
MLDSELDAGGAPEQADAISVEASWQNISFIWLAIYVLMI